LATVDIRFIPLGLVDEPDGALRQHIDMEYVRELGESIREQGLLQAVLVRPVGDRFELIWGHMRYLAHKMISKADIKAEVRELSDEEAVVLRATENLQRKDLTVMETARCFGMFREKLHYSIEKIAHQMGKNRITIRRYLELLEVPVEFHAALDSGELGMGVAEILMAIDNVELRRYYLQNAISGGCSKKTAELWVSDYNATRAAQGSLGLGGEGVSTELVQPKPTYYACDLCNHPVEVSQARHVMVCPECAARLRGGLAAGGGS
jgi:ParB/RepB/Spo0J family partition protein